MGRDPRGSGGTGKAEAAKCVLCIPATGLRAWESSRSSAQAKARGKGENVPQQFIRGEGQATHRGAKLPDNRSGRQET